METITGILIDTKREIAEVVTIPHDIEEYYRILDCSIFDIVHRRIGRRNFAYDIICDDEGLLNKDAKISAIDDLGTPMLVGNLFIVKFDGEENETSLNDDDINYIMRHIHKQATRRYPKPYPMLHQCEYQ